MSLEKHQKYKSSYGSNELYWGLGIEQETYFQYRTPIYVAAPLIRQNHKPERYSVKYYSNYKNYIPMFHQLFPDTSGCIPFPLLLNAHGICKMDLSGNHRTTYEKIPNPNPKFSGTTLLQELLTFSNVWKEGYEKWFTFDGDTIEFMTQHFYKASVKKSVRELIEYKQTLLHELNRFIQTKKAYWFCEKGFFQYSSNPGFAIHATNPGNISMFNNGTYHFNITLPTYLGSSGEIVFPDKFREDHRKFIRLIQWMEPFFIAMYGSPDPFSKQSPLYSKASQRAAVSRYIGIGTFDSEEMSEGKCNTKPLTHIGVSKTEYWWYTRYHQTSGYVALEELGMDINYKKHFQHGCELRFFDWFPEQNLEKLLEICILLAEASFHLPLAPVAGFQQSWNDCVIGIMDEGNIFSLTPEIKAAYEKHLGMDFQKNTVKEIWEEICLSLKIYKKGKIAKCFLN